MSSDAVVELPPFKRCFNALISFSIASTFSGLLLLSNVVTNRGGAVEKHCEKEDETRTAGICSARDDGHVRECLHVKYVSACSAATSNSINTNGIDIIALQNAKGR